jgi:hypothetical protein
MPPNAPANVGREAIRAWYATAVFAAADYDDFTTTPGEIDGANRLAFNRGSYWFTTVPTGPELLMNAIREPSGDHDGTLMVPWPPYT